MSGHDYTPEPGDELRNPPSRPDIVVFGIVPWTARWHRPHHFAAELARRGHRVVYLSPLLASGRVSWQRVAAAAQPTNVVLAQLASRTLDTVHRGTPWDWDEIATVHHTFRDMCQSLRLLCPILFVQTPAWWPLVEWIRERSEVPLVYDCLDEHSGWNHEAAELLRGWERSLVRSADLVLASAERLRRRLEVDAPNVLLVPNGCEPDHFAAAATPTATLAPPLHRPVIGYAGALSSSWFDTSLLVTLAERRPDWTFVLIGPADAELQVTVDTCPNILLLGEVPYTDLPRYVADFDVAIIPFLVNELTRATDPVKLYEYFAATKPVVVTPMPELYSLQGLLTIATDAESFERAIAAFLRAPGDAAAREAVARQASWRERVDSFYRELIASLPSLDVVVVTYNNVALSRACFASLRGDRSYPARWIVVDNASTDATPALLDELEQEEVLVIRNPTNAGFAAANNQGIQAGCGRYVLLLNNDTQVPRGGLLALAHALAWSRDVGLAGPVTNRIGNEAEIRVGYEQPSAVALGAQFRELQHARFGRRFDIRVAALFAGILRRADLAAIGGLDEVFKIGMFEDDALADRVRSLGKRVVCCEDIFVHHEGSASFSALDRAVYRALLERNRRLFERASGTLWQPHAHRPDRHRPVG
jgi:GT2 family glycosyltransferase/glycosyltransferase involved in cell wall biosynthesis